MLVEVKLIISILVILFSFLTGVGLTYHFEHKQISTLESSLKTQAAAQAVKVATINKTIEDNSNEAVTTLTQSNSAIADYYKQHPSIRVLHGACTGSVSQTVDNSTPANDSTSTVFISPFDPEQCTIVATQLKDLQELLLKDGVTVK